jgi:hypothetical protein
LESLQGMIGIIYWTVAVAAEQWSKLLVLMKLFRCENRFLIRKKKSLCISVIMRVKIQQRSLKCLHGSYGIIEQLCKK